MLLLDVYNQDGIFSKAESEEFLSLYNANHRSFSERDCNYAKLHYKIGFLYANGYEETSTGRLRKAIPFFEIAADTISENDPNILAVTSYNMIGKYYQEYIWDASAIREVSSEEMISLVNEIRDTVLAYQTDTSSEALFNSLGFYEAVCNLFYSQRDVLAITVPQETVQDILDQIYGNLPDPDRVQNQQIKQLLNDLSGNEEMYQDMIQRAYERWDGGVSNGN